MDKTKAQIIAKQLYDRCHKYPEYIAVPMIELELLKAEFNGFKSIRPYLQIKH